MFIIQCRPGNLISAHQQKPMGIREGKGIIVSAVARAWPSSKVKTRSRWCQIISHPLLMTIHTDNERNSSRMVRSDCHQTNSGVILFLDDHMEGYAWAGRF